MDEKEPDVSPSRGMACSHLPQKLSRRHCPAVLGPKVSVWSINRTRYVSASGFAGPCSGLYLQCSMDPALRLIRFCDVQSELHTAWMMAHTSCSSPLQQHSIDSLPHLKAFLALHRTLQLFSSPQLPTTPVWNSKVCAASLWSRQLS